MFLKYWETIVVPENISQKVNKIENYLLSLNSDLISQNLKLSRKVFPDYVNPNQNDYEIEEKELFYEEINDNLYKISGSGTYDNRETIKTNNGNWDKDNKVWIMNISVDKLIEIFPKIKNKL